MKRLIVKPIPVRIEAPYSSSRVVFFGRWLIFSLKVIRLKRKTPICLPKNKPKMMPRMILLLNIDSSEKPDIGTPALAKANIGSTTKLTKGESLRAKSSRKNLFFVLNGMNMAKATPAMLGWIPEPKTKIHNIRPRIMYKDRLSDFLTPKRNNPNMIVSE